MVKLYVEGGGDATALRTACREGFSSFLEKAGLKGKMPRVVACGSRSDAYDSYCTAVRNGDEAMLLVDSEAPVDATCSEDQDSANWLPWLHLKRRQGDGWGRPEGCADTDCHLMVQCMESWFLADRETLKKFFGQGFKEKALPAIANPIESVPKAQVYQALAEASKDCKTKAQYGKGEHSFKILKLVDPATITAASPWANRFVIQMRAKMGVR